jgi:hypothetical protein
MKAEFSGPKACEEPRTPRPARNTLPRSLKQGDIGFRSLATLHPRPLHHAAGKERHGVKERWPWPNPPLRGKGVLVVLRACLGVQSQTNLSLSRCTGDTAYSPPPRASPPFIPFHRCCP